MKILKYLFFILPFVFINDVYALDYSYESIWAGQDSNSSVGFYISANDMISGPVKYYTPMGAKQDFLMVSYCASGTVSAVFSDNGQLANNSYHIDSQESCSAYGVLGTLQYSYFPVKYWNYTDTNSFAYIDGGTSHFRNHVGYNVKVAFYGIQNVSSLDVSMAILANMKTKEGKDYHSILNEIKANQDDYKQELNNVKNAINSTNNKLDNLNSSLNDDDTSGAKDTASDFFSGFTTDTHGLTSIITAPLNLIKSITNKTCSSLSLQVPFLDNKTLDLPCMSSIYSKHFGSFLTIYQTITFGIVAYWVCVNIFRLVKDFKNPEHDEIEVMDL